MDKYKLAISFILLLSSMVNAEPVIEEKMIIDIGNEIAQAVKDNDLSVIEKYMYEGSKIVIDTDPAPNRGQKEIGYDEYMQLLKMSMGMMKNAVIHDELISISIDKDKNEGTIEQKTTAVVEMMGMKLQDVSINTTTYGVVEGEIKVLIGVDELISSGPIN